MTRNSKLDIYIHWQTVSPKMKIPKVWAANYPVKLKDMIDPEVYHQDDVDSQMTLDQLKEMLTKNSSQLTTTTLPPFILKTSCPKLLYMVYYPQKKRLILKHHLKSKSIEHSNQFLIMGIGSRLSIQPKNYSNL